MKPMLFILWMLTYPVLGQDSGTLKVKKPKPKFSVTAIGSPSNSLYAYVENYIEVIAPKGEYDYRFGPGSLLMERRNGYLLVLPYEADYRDLDFGVFQIFKKGTMPQGKDPEKEEEVLFSQRFVVLPIPNPYPSWAGLSGGRVEKWQLDPRAEIKLLFKDVDYQATQHWSEVTRFTFTIQSPGNRQEFKAEGNKLTYEMQSALRNIKAGDKITIWDIKRRRSSYREQVYIRPIKLEIY